jgi:hypothetical protein
MKAANLFFLLAILLATASAEDWILDNNGGVYWENANARISAWPAISKSPVGDHTQYINFSYFGSQPRYINISFVFPEAITEGKAYYLTETSRTIQKPIYINQTIEMNGTNITNLIRSGYENVLEYYTDYLPINRVFSTTKIGNKRIYTANDVYFNPGQTYQLKLDYRTNTNGKFDIVAHRYGVDQVLATGGYSSPYVYVVLDPWFNSSYALRALINCTNTFYGLPIAINGSKGFNLNGTNQTVWTICQPNLYLYFNSNFDYQVANNTARVPMEVEKGNVSSYLPSSVWANQGAKGIYHMAGVAALTDASDFANGSVTGTPTSAGGIFGNGWEVVGSQYANDISASFTKLTACAWIDFANGTNRRLFGTLGYITSSYYEAGTPRMNTFQLSPYQDVGTGTTGFAEWGYWCHTQSGTTAREYANGTLKNSNNAYANSVSSISAFQVLRAQSIDPWVGKVDEFRVFDDEKNATWINNTFENAIGTLGYGSLDPAEAPPAESIDFISQTPANITSANIVATPADILYNFTGTFNFTTITLFHKTNTTLSDCTYYVNGTGYCGWLSRPYTDNISNTYNFTLYDNQILPGTYNYEERTMETTPHTAFSLSTSNHLFKMEFLNVTNTSRYNIFEIMANITAGSAPLELFYCNSTYATGNPSTSSNCVNFNSIEATTTYNHSHSSYSSHNYASLVFLNGYADSVKVTPTSYIIAKTTSPASWDLWYIANLSRTSAMQYSVNGGTSYSDQAFTIDAHIHQLSNSTLYYFASGNLTNGSVKNDTTIYSDLIDLQNVAPTEPTIKSPDYGAYLNGSSLNITYLNSSSPTGLTITKYNISLFYANNTLAKLLVANNSPNNNYTWPINITKSGVYTIRITALDSGGFYATSISPPIFLYNYSQGYNAVGSDLYEQNHTITVAADNSIDAINGTMLYNSVTYGATVTNTSNNYQLKAAGLPSLVTTPTNYTAYFTAYVYSAYGDYNFTANNTQRIVKGGIFACDANSTTETLNITAIDVTAVPIPNSTVIINYQFTYNNSRAITGTTINDSHIFCLDASNSSYYGVSAVTTVSATGYTAKNLIETLDFTTVKLDKPVILLNGSAASYYTFTIINDYSIGIPAANFYVYDSGLTSLLDYQVTNPDGTTAVSLTTLVPVVINVTATGYQPYAFNFTPSTITSIRVKLTFDTTTPLVIPVYEEQFNNISWGISPDNQTTFNQSFNITYFVNATNLSYFGMKIVRNFNGTYTTVYDTNSTNSTGGVLQYTATQNGTYSVAVYLKPPSQAEYKPFPKMYYLNTRSGLALAGQNLGLGNIFSGWGYYFLIVVFAMVAGGFASKFSLEGAAFISLLVLWFGTLVWPGAVIVSLATGFDLTALHATILTTIGVISLMGVKNIF